MSLFVRTGNGGLNPAVKINDLGYTVSPGVTFQELTVGSTGNPFDGYGQFTPYEIYKSVDLYTLITTGALEASRNGTLHDLPADEYTISYAIQAAERVDISSDIPQFVTVGKGGDVDFTSVKEAIDSITDASLANIYTVLVYPGVYSEDTITMKTGINLVGVGNLVAIIVPSVPTNDIMIIADASSIFGIIFNGEQGHGTSSLTYTSTSTNSSNTCLIQNCFFATNDTHIKMIGGDPGTFTNVEMVNCRFGGLLSNFSTAIDISNPSGGNAYLSMSACNMFSADNTPPNDFLLADGYGSVVSISSCDISTKDVEPGQGTAFHVRNGARLSISAIQLSGWNTAIYAENNGDAPNLKIVGANLFDNVVDLNIEHPDTVGSFSGVLDFDKISVNTDSLFAVSASDHESGSNIILNELRFGKTVATATDVGDLILGSPTLGVNFGGDLTAGAGFTVNVAAGFGYVELNTYPNTQLEKIEWNNTSLALPANAERYIHFNFLGVLTSSAFLPDSKMNIILGRVVTHGTAIDFIDDSNINANHSTNSVEDYLRTVFGSTYVSGSIATDAGSRQLNVSSGAYYFSQSKKTPSGASPITFTTYYGDGASGFNRELGQTQINNTQYDDGSGTLATLTDGYYSKHTLYTVGDGYNEQYLIVYSQDQFESQLAAENASLAVPPTFFSDGVALLASIVILKNSSTLNITDERNIRGNSPTALAAASDHGNLIGLLDDDHPQYLLSDGSRALSGNLDLGGFNVVNVNLVDGVDVANHASRHLPNGGDPLTTAIPVTISSANSIGTANSLARSDHVHAHGNLGGGSQHAVATTSTAGFLSATDKARLDILSQETTLLTVRNETGTTLTKGRLVAVTGYNSLLSVLLVGYADKDTDSLRPAVGALRTDIPNNTTDLILVNGILTNVDTSAFSLTDQLVLGDDGYFTRPPPDNVAFTGEVQCVGSVAKVGSIDGIIIVDAGQGLNPVTGNQIFALAGTDGYASASNKYVTNSDPRNTNSRAPTGAASGQLGGSYPSPDVRGIRETSGPTELTVGSISDGYYLRRSSSNLIGNPYATSLQTFYTHAPGPITTTSLTDVTVTNMTLTPGAGSYIFWFSSDVSNINNNRDIFVSLYVNGVQVLDSERNIHVDNAVERSCAVLNGMITGVTAGQVVDVRWRVSANTGSMGNRSLTLLKVSDS